MSCGHWWLAEVNEMLLDFISTLFCWRLNRGWNTDWVITRVKTSSKREGMMAFTLLKSAACHGSDTEPELIAAAWVNACVGFIPARFWIVPEAALQCVYTTVCHATSKTVKTAIIIWISWKKKNTPLVHVYRTERSVLKRFGMNSVPLHPYWSVNGFCLSCN